MVGTHPLFMLRPRRRNARVSENEAVRESGGSDGSTLT